MTASAKTEDTFFNSVIPSRIDHLIGFTPTTYAIHPLGQRVVPITVRVGGRTYRYTFGNAAAWSAPRPHLSEGTCSADDDSEPAGDLPRPAVEEV
jgi:hypothetical protein